MNVQSIASLLFLKCMAMDQVYILEETRMLRDGGVHVVSGACPCMTVHMLCLFRLYAASFFG